MANHLLNTQRPPAKLSEREKMKDNFDVMKDWIEYIYSNSRFYGDLNRYDHYDELTDLYDLAAGKVPKSWVNTVTNPTNEKNNDKGNESKVDDYNLLYSNFALLIGEMIDRPLSYQVENKSPDAASKKKEEESAFIKKDLFNRFTDLNLGNEPESQSLDKKLDKWNTSYKDNKALRGQNIMDYYTQEDEYEDKRIEMWKHFLIAGQTYCRTDVRDDDVTNIPISPKDIDHAANSNDYTYRFIEDADWVCVRYNWSPSQILDYFRDEMDDDMVELLDDTSLTGMNRLGSIYPHYFKSTQWNNVSNDVLIEVIHCQWRMYRKIGIVTYPDMLTGELEQVEVSEEFKLTDDLESLGWSIEYEWVDDIWEGWVVDPYGSHFKNRNNAKNWKYPNKKHLGNGKFDRWRIFLGINRLFTQTRKLSYNGIYYYRTETDFTSFLKMGRPYQKLFSSIFYRLEKAVKKSQGEGVLMPIEAVMGGEGREDWNWQKFLETFRELGVGFYTLSDPDIRKLGLSQFLGKINVTSFNEINFYSQLLLQIQNLWDRYVGISEPRKSQQQASQAVGSVEQSISRSMAITEYFFHKFESFEKRLLQKTLDMTQFAYLEGKHLTVVRDDNSVAHVDIDGYDHMNSEYGIFMNKSNEERRKLEKMRGIAEKLATQGNNPYELSEIIYANNSAMLKDILYQLKNKEEQAMAQQQQSEKEAVEMQRQFDMEMKELEAEIDKLAQMEIDDNRHEHKKEELYIQGQNNQLSFQNTLDADGDGIEDIRNVEENSLRRTELMGKMAKDSADIRINQQKNLIQEKKLAMEERIAKMNAKAKASNPTSGESTKQTNKAIKNTKNL